MDFPLAVDLPVDARRHTFAGEEQLLYEPL
jgi:hypothetical protein